MNVANSFFSEIICMDIDPISRKMTMKKVAGFHSFGFFALAVSSLDEDRSGFGIIDFQKEGLATFGTVELMARDARTPDCGLRKTPTVMSSSRWSGDRFMLRQTDLCGGCAKVKARKGTKKKKDGAVISQFDVRKDGLNAAATNGKCGVV